MLIYKKLISAYALVPAHVRGGGEMGRKWYEDEGKFLQKKNTFNDFVDCADKLIELVCFGISLRG